MSAGAACAVNPLSHLFPPDNGLDGAGRVAVPAAPRPLDRLQQATPLRHCSIRTEDAYADRARQFILFHGKRHPQNMGPLEVEVFLSHLAPERKVAPHASTSSARSAPQP